jgi:hypothetical protein
MSHFVAGLADDRARFAGLKAAADEAEQQLAQRGARGSDFDRDKFERMYVLLYTTPHYILFRLRSDELPCYNLHLNRFVIICT